MNSSYTGKQRLAIFLSVIWVALITAISASDPTFNLIFFIVAGAFPVGFIWGLAWVIKGFKS
jgi:hypothetical protein